MRKRRYFTEARREAYLEGLGRTGNHSAAAREAGVTAAAARRYRRRKPEFEALCRQSEEEAQRRLAGAELGPVGGSAFESIRRGADGRLKIQAQGSRRWSKRSEDRFFDVLRESGNIAASARAAGVSREAVWKRRRNWPAFARRFEEASEEAEVVLEFRVLCLGTNWTEAAEQSDGDETEAAEQSDGDETETPPGARAEAPAFDPELALRFLKWRWERKGRDSGAAGALPSAEEVRERIVRKVAAVRRHKEREQARKAQEEGDE